MKKAIATLILSIVVWLPHNTARAELCTIDAVPAATLLLPYFEADITRLNGTRTFFSINNATAAPALAKVILWTDLSVPTLSFHVYLTGYDSQEIDLNALFLNGQFPQTSDTLSNQGSFSNANTSFSGCDSLLPPTRLTLSQILGLQKAHTGKASSFFSGNCGGVDHNDSIARGYITIDNVNLCSTSVPGNSGYFTDGGVGVANNTNQLWGDWFIIDPAQRSADGDNLVHIEAGNSFNNGDYTFYGRYVSSDGSDDREPLGTTWGTRYLTSGSNSTYLAAWRDSGIVQSSFTCGTTPSPFSLGFTQIVSFDEQEEAQVLSSIAPFPYETGYISVGSTNLPVTFTEGWLYFNLNTSTGGAFDPVKQSYVGASHYTNGVVGASYGGQGLAFDSACMSSPITFP